MSLTKTRSLAQSLLDFEIWVVVAFTGLGFLSTRILPIAVLVGIVFWGLRWFGSGYPSVRMPVDGAVLILLLMLPVTLWATGEPETTQIQAFRLLNGIALFYAVVNWTDSAPKLRWLIYGLLFLGILLAFYASVSVEWATQKIPFIPTSLYERFTLLVGDTVHRNVMAGTLILILPISISLLLFLHPPFRKREVGLILFATLIISAILILTQSRGALLAFAVTLLILIALRWKWGFIPMFLLMLGGVIFVTSYGFSNSFTWLISNGLFDELPGRFETWHRAGYMIQDFPFTGIGMGTYTSVAEMLYPFILADPASAPHAHNLFLQVAVDLGIPGLVAWMAIWLTSAFTAWKIYRAGRTTNDAWLAGVGAGLLGSQLAMALHGLLDAVTWGMVRPAPLVWAIWGLIFACSRVIFQKAETQIHVE